MSGGQHVYRLKREFDRNTGEPIGPETYFAGRELIESGKSPFGVPGDRLWVRETWMGEEGGVVQYRADWDHEP